MSNFFLMQRLKALILYLSGRNYVVFCVILISAIWVTLVRLLGPIRMYWDLSVQLEAATRLAQGLGLTNAFSPQFDLNQPPISEYLTHFPPGMSLLVAALLAVGIPLAIALKIIYGTTTIVGWIGWAIIASRCLKYPLKIRNRLFPGHVLTAVILPVFYTPFWTNQGTDIVLWAGVPIFSLLLLMSFRVQLWAIPAILSGLVFGILLAFRYASAFLAIAALFILISVGLPSFKAILKRFILFWIASSTLIIPLVLYIKNIPTTSSLKSSTESLLYNHGARHLSSNLLESIIDSLDKNFISFSKLSALTGFHSGKIYFILESHPILIYLTGLGYFLILSLLTSKLIQYSRRQKFFSERDTLILLICLIFSLIIFAFHLTFFTSYNLLGKERYYIPIQFCLILIAYRIATLSDFNQAFRYFSVGLVFSFIIFNMILRPIYYFVEPDKDLGHDILAIDELIANIQYPSNQIFTYWDTSLQFLKKVEVQEPDALFFIQRYPAYMSYYNFAEPFKFRRIPDESFWRNAYLSESTKIFWVINNEDCPSICAAHGNFNSDDPRKPIRYLASLPNLRVVFSDPVEKTIVLNSQLPAGYRFNQQ